MESTTITLYQHTPLIHFQGDQTGGTLRATEVKPQLDRWLIMKYGQHAMKIARDQAAKEAGETETKKIVWNERQRYKAGWAWLHDHHPGWLALSDDREENQRSLNYRMTLEAGPEHPLNGEPAKGFANYFADMGNDPLDPPDRLLTFHHTVQLTITTPDPLLWKELDKELTSFFYATNFGMRSSKGFGSFSPAEAIPNNWVFKFKIDYKRSQKQPASKKQLKNEYESLFRHLEFFHRSIRTGLNKFNDPDLVKAPTLKQFWDKKKQEKTTKIIYAPMNTTFYMKPVLFTYAASMGLVWEKKLIKEKTQKEKFHDPSNPNSHLHQNPYSNPNDGSHWPAWFDFQNHTDTRTKATVRDVMGLSTKQKWAAYGFDVSKKSVDNRPKNAKNTAIDRAPSPFTFVPVQMLGGFAIYVYVHQPWDRYLSHEIEVKAGSAHIGDIKVFPNFDMADFLRKSLNVTTAESSIITLGDKGNAHMEEIYDALKQEDDNDEISWEDLEYMRVRDEQLKNKLLTMYHQAETSLKPQNITQP